MQDQQEKTEDKPEGKASGNPVQSLVVRLAEKYGIEPGKFLKLVKSAAFRQEPGEPEPTDAQVGRLLIVSEKYDLDPFIGQLYGQRTPRGDVLPVVTVDGWFKMINDHPQCDGFEFKYSDKLVHMNGSLVPAHEWMEIIVHRKDRERPTVIREFLDEVYKGGVEPNGGLTPWQTHTKRCHRHKTLIQGGRAAFGFTGIYDPDEADNILRGLRSSGPATDVQPKAAALIYKTREEVDKLLDGLIKRARGDGNWKQCVDYLRDRLQNQPDLREYALQRLSDEEFNGTEKPEDQKSPAEADQPRH